MRIAVAVLGVGLLAVSAGPFWGQKSGEENGVSIKKSTPAKATEGSAAPAAAVTNSSAPNTSATAAPESNSAALSTRDAVVKPVSAKQKQLQDDIDKLVLMSAELKVSVDKSNKNELSMEVVRKAEAVERLAKSVKERMRDAK